MRLRAFYRGSTFGGSDQSFIQSLADLPIGQWVHVEAFLFQSAAAAGLFTLWQDGLKILEVSGIQTRYADGDQRWSLGQSSDGLTPDIGTVYFDDVVISRTRVSVDPSPIIWVATHEAGNLAEWGDGSGPSGGGLFNDGVHTVAASAERAHSGTRSMKMTIDTTAGVDTAVRAFRWKESYTKQDLYYSAWYYFPQSHVPTTFWNIMQFKGELYDAGGVQTKNDPIITIGVTVAGGASRLHMFYFGHFFGGTDQQFNQSILTLPIGQWTHIEAFLHQAPDATGVFMLWQNGTRILEVTNLQTNYTPLANGYQTWSVNNYSNGLTPAIATIYIDDAVISRTRVGTAIVPPPPSPPPFAAILAALSSIAAAIRRRRRLVASLASQAQISAALNAAGEVSFSASLASASATVARNGATAPGSNAALRISVRRNVNVCMRRNRRLAASMTSQSALSASLTTEGRWRDSSSPDSTRNTAARTSPMRRSPGPSSTNFTISPCSRGSSTRVGEHHHRRLDRLAASVRQRTGGAAAEHHWRRNSDLQPRPHQHGLRHQLLRQGCLGRHVQARPHFGWRCHGLRRCRGDSFGRRFKAPVSFAYRHQFGSDPSIVMSDANMASLIAQRDAQNPNCKIFLTLGGASSTASFIHALDWNGDALVDDATYPGLAGFVDYYLDIVALHGFDGVDVDAEVLSCTGPEGLGGHGRYVYALAPELRAQMNARWGTGLTRKPLVMGAFSRSASSNTKENLAKKLYR